MTNVAPWKKLAIVAMALVLIYSLTAPEWKTDVAPARTNEEVAIGVFEDYGFTFMLLALVLAAAMIGGIFMAKMPHELGRRIYGGKVVVMKFKDRKPARRHGRGGV